MIKKIRLYLIFIIIFYVLYLAFYLIGKEFYKPSLVYLSYIFAILGSLTIFRYAYLSLKYKKRKLNFTRSFNVLLLLLLAPITLIYKEFIFCFTNDSQKKLKERVMLFSIGIFVTLFAISFSLYRPAAKNYLAYNNTDTPIIFDVITATTFSMSPLIKYLGQLYIQTEMMNRVIKLHEKKLADKNFCYEVRSKAYKDQFSSSIQSTLDLNTYAFYLLYANVMTKLHKECLWELEKDYKDKARLNRYSILHLTHYLLIILENDILHNKNHIAHMPFLLPFNMLESVIITIFTDQIKQNEYDEVYHVLTQKLNSLLLNTNQIDHPKEVEYATLLQKRLNAVFDLNQRSKLFPKLREAR